MSLQKHFNAAMEDVYAHDPVAAQRGLYGDTNAIAMEMDSHLAEISRLMDVADALKDIEASVESLAHADPHHLMLLEASLNLAVAGTLKSAQDIQPSLENHLGTTISTEGVGRTIKDVIANIIRLVREMWQLMAEFFERVLGEVARAKLRMQYVRALVNEIDGKDPVRDRVSIGNSVIGVATESGVPHNAASIIISLNEMLHQSQYMRTHVVPMLLDMGQKLSVELPKWSNDPEKSEQWLTNLNNIVGVFKPHEIAHAVGKAYTSHSPAYPHGVALTLAPLPGLRSLAFIDGMKMLETTAEAKPAELALAYQNHDITLLRQRQAGNYDVEHAAMDVITNNNHLAHILDVVEKVLDEAEYNIKQGLRTKLEKVGRQMNDAVAHIQAEDSDKGRLQRGVRYTVAFPRWVRNSYVNLVAHDLMVSRAMMTFVAHHCAAYNR